MEMAMASRSLAAALWPCALYFGCSLAMNMLTKALLTTFAWRAVYALGALQNAFALAALALLRLLGALPGARAGAGASTDAAEATPAPKSCGGRGSKPDGASDSSISARGAAGIAARDGGRWGRRLRVLAPLAALNLANVLLGFVGLQAVDLPMYLVLRRLTTLKILLIEWLVLHKAISNPVKLALLVSAVGSVVAGATDLSLGRVSGYALVLLQNVCSACSLAFSKESALSSLQLVTLNAVVGVCCCSVLALALEWPLVRDFPSATDPLFLALLLCSCTVCVLYQFAVYNCTLRTSALTTSVTGNIKDLVATIGGFLLFPDAHLSAANAAGVALSFLGAYSFSYARYRALLALDAAKLKRM